MDYTRNEDRLVRDLPIGATYNHIYNVENASMESGEVTEPVTLQEVKNYLRLEGFNTDDSPGDDAVDFDDDLIEEMISEARMWAEKQTGLHLVPKTLQVVLLNQAGMIEIPGPVTGDITITDMDGEAVDSDSYDFVGSQFKKLVTPFDNKIILTYDAGYTQSTIPKGLKGAIKSYIAFMYEHRGDETIKAAPEIAIRKARPYSRGQLWG